MNFDDEDNLKLQHLAGGNIVSIAPVFSEQGRFIFVICGSKVQVFVSSTGELTRELIGATSELISLELELKQPEVLVCCTSNGDILRWHWRTGVLQSTISLKLGNEIIKVMAFNLINMYADSDTACANVIVKEHGFDHLKHYVANTSTGKKICVNCNLKLRKRAPLVDTSRKDLPYIAIAQGRYIFILNYKTWDYVRMENKAYVTFVKFSTCDELLAIGDTRGRVYMWRNFIDPGNARRVRYHWHSTPITSIAFTPSGNTFYTSGHESVLVKWSMHSKEERQYLPRMSDVIRHIVISDGFEQVVVSTNDNALHFIGPSDNLLKSTIQNFTIDKEDDTGKPIFALGLQVNPRNNTLVLNGRIGYMQFYSAYTKSLLYNLRIVESNVLSKEDKRILYNTRVTCAAFNIDWMATGEVYNDERNYPELRLKFWQFNEKLQTYMLNTNIELPHEDAFRAIVFSNQFQVDNLRCATVGKDNIIKLWGLEESENIYRPGLMWSCLAQTSYKNYPIQSLCFSQDGSLLAAGCGNTLCLYDPRTLHLVHALTSSAGYDGVIPKAQLRLSKTPVNGTRKEYTTQRQKLWAILQTLLVSDDAKLVQEARELIATAPSNQIGKQRCLDEDMKPVIFKHIMKMSELSLHQKLQLLRCFGVECAVPDNVVQDLLKYMRHAVVSVKARNNRLKILNARLLRMDLNKCYRATHRLTQYELRKRRYDKGLRNKLPLINVFKSGKKVHKPKQETKSELSVLLKKSPVQMLGEISHVQFGAGAQAHLVTVCTESRVLIWNLLTLRLQAGLKLSVCHLAFDPLTNLMAVITHKNELHVFQPNVPLPVYQRSNLPSLYGMSWLPRRQPKQRSINVDWQSQSTLHMLTQDRTIVYLSASDAGIDDDPAMSAHISFAKPAEPAQLKFATFGTYAIKQQGGEAADAKRNSGPLIIGRGRQNAVDVLTSSSAHTMSEMSRICGGFIKSLLTPAETTVRHNASRMQPKPDEQALQNGNTNGNSLLHSDDEEPDAADKDLEAQKALKRKALLAQNSEPFDKTTADSVSLPSKNTPTSLEHQLQRIAALTVNLKL